ncbi:hypothetical protein GCM10010282_22430 [Streptomyces roseolus]|nr:hypothetical protein GCM10010282_22430 [Streptomyces roseolus]
MEASIVAVRRGMERQYGTRLCAHPWGGPYGTPPALARGDGQDSAETGSAACRNGAESGAVGWERSMASRKRA